MKRAGSRFIVFGATGYLGSAICDELKSSGFIVIPVVRGPGNAFQISMESSDWLSKLRQIGPFDGVVWAQGANSTGGLLEEESEGISASFDANVLFIFETMKALVSAKLLASPSRAVILSSIWQLTARPKKIAYVVAKSALSGLVPTLALDLASHGIAVNAVLPGVIESPMSRRNLDPAQLEQFERESIGGQLATANQVAKVTRWLLTSDSSGINGQSITVDHGWSNVRYV